MENFHKGVEELACKEVLCSTKFLASHILRVSTIGVLTSQHEVKICNHTELNVANVTQWSSLRSS